MNCPRCQRSNDAHRRYCGDCGTEVATSCKSCTFLNALADHFCGGCGESVASPPSEVETADSPVIETRASEVEPELSREKVDELLTVRRTRFASIIPSKVTQDDLDKLFDKP